MATCPEDDKELKEIGGSPATTVPHLFLGRSASPAPLKISIDTLGAWEYGGLIQPAARYLPLSLSRREREEGRW
jgi:hypothetical protein